MSHWLPAFATPIWAALFGLLVPLLVFYFLKLKRPRVELPSLALWRQVISDQRVNAPFQRFKRSLLLLLQILILTLLVLAAMQPFWRGDLQDATYLPILIDNSASMAAKDQATGLTRLELARREIQKIVDGLLPGQKLSLISVGATARRLTDFTDNRADLTDKLARLQVSDVPSKLDDGLRLAQALSRTNPVSSVRLYSDGNLPTRTDPASGAPVAAIDFDLPFRLDFQQLPAAGPNMGITAFNARRASTSKWDVFVRVDASDASGTAGRIVLLNHGQPIDEEQVILSAKESQRLVFSVDAEQPASLNVQLRPEGFDALETDNEAWLQLPIGRDLTVYCASSLGSYRHALEGIPGVLIEPAADGSSKLSGYDLLISDSEVDAAREATTLLFVGVVPGDLQDAVTLSPGLTEVVDWQRDAPLLQHVQLRDVQAMDIARRATTVDDSEIESRGYDFLAQGSAGPLILQKREAAKLKMYLLFNTDRSTLPYRVGFPVLVTNLANIALQQAELAELSAAPTGSLPRLSLSPNVRYQVTSPTGEHFDQETDGAGFLTGIPATDIGLYEIRRGGDLVSRTGVSLLSPTETSLFGVSEIQLNEVAISAAEERIKAIKPWWTTLAALAFVLLLVEWWVFQKRPGRASG